MTECAKYIELSESEFLQVVQEANYRGPVTVNKQVITDNVAVVRYEFEGDQYIDVWNRKDGKILMAEDGEPELHCSEDLAHYRVMSELLDRIPCTG